MISFITSWKGIVAALMAAAFIATSVLAVDRYVAKDADLRLVAMRLDQKIQDDKKDRLQDRKDRMQERVWNYEDRYGCSGLADCKKFMPKEVYEMYRQMVRDLVRVE